MEKIYIVFRDNEVEGWSLDIEQIEDMLSRRDKVFDIAEYRGNKVKEIMDKHYGGRISNIW